MQKESECMLTTFDNPFDPFEQYDQWLMFDIEHNYNCCGKLARFANVTDDMTSVEEKIEIERAIDRIIELDVLDIYKKVRRSTSR